MKHLAATLAALVAVLLIANPTVACVECCLLEEPITATSEDSVLVSIHVQPSTRIVVSVNHPGGDVIYAERVRMTDASGRRTERFDLGELGYVTGDPLVAGVATKAPCNPAIVKVAVVLPDTSVGTAPDVPPPPLGPLALLFGVSALASIAWLRRTRSAS